MRYRDRFKTRKSAFDAMAEEQSWQCDCGKMLEDGQSRYCRSCQSYHDAFQDYIWELPQ